MKLTDDPRRYFEEPPGSFEVELTRLLPCREVRRAPLSIEGAETHMVEALAGGPKRAPISVVARGHGLYEILDGSSTVAVALKHGFRTVIVQEEIDG